MTGTVSAPDIINDRNPADGSIVPNLKTVTVSAPDTINGRSHPVRSKAHLLKTVTVSAPGKIHLLGEHAVVYGYPALLSSIDRRLSVQITPIPVSRGNESGIPIETPEANLELVRYVIRLFEDKFHNGTLTGIAINIFSGIPAGSGMGSSAAVSAALFGALLKYFRNIWNPTAVNNLAYEAEKHSHGNPSGADNTTVTFGGLIWYRREFDFLKSIWQLPVKQYTIPRFALINTGRPFETTAEMVSSVKRLYTENQKRIVSIFSDQEKLTKKLLLSLKSNDMSAMRSAIFYGERNLEKIGVVGKTAHQLIREIEKNGGVAKVCGAGGKKRGSGMVLCYHKDMAVLSEIAGRCRLDFMEVHLGGEGIRLENVK